MSEKVDPPEHVVPLRDEVPPAARPSIVPPARPGRLHGLAIFGMAAFAITGSLATLAFITVGWPGSVARYVTTAIVLSAVGFVASASAAILSAARDTYPRRSSPGRGGEGRQ